MGVVAVAVPEAVARGQLGRQRAKTNREMKTEAEEGRRLQLGSQLVDASVNLLFVPPFEVKCNIIESRFIYYFIFFHGFKVAAFKINRL